jgi:hypothetical protein
MESPAAVAHVGILAMDVYFPKDYVSQEACEMHDGVAPGKYTAGLGESHIICWVVFMVGGNHAIVHLFVSPIID